MSSLVPAIGAKCSMKCFWSFGISDRAWKDWSKLREGWATHAVACACGVCVCVYASWLLKEGKHFAGMLWGVNWGCHCALSCAFGSLASYWGSNMCMSSDIVLYCGWLILVWTIDVPVWWGVLGWDGWARAIASWVCTCNIFTLLLRFSQFTKRTGTRYISMVFFKWQEWVL